MNFRHRQSGLSAIAILLIILVAAFFGTCTLKLLPEYMESFTVKEIMENIAEEAKSESLQVGEINARISNQFVVNMVHALQKSDVKVTRKEGKTIIDARYEKRIPLMFNIDVVLKFDKFIYEF